MISMSDPVECQFYFPNHSAAIVHRPIANAGNCQARVISDLLPLPAKEEPLPSIRPRQIHCAADGPGDQIPAKESFQDRDKVDG
jgi:hypothetical protein